MDTPLANRIRFGYLSGMKLSHYLTLHDIRPADFAAALGIKSRMTLYRYLVGSRRPGAVTLAKIVQQTQGQVTEQDFAVVAAKPKPASATPPARAPKAKPTPFAQDLSPVVLTALRVLGTRAGYRPPNQFQLDGRPISLPKLIDAANQALIERGQTPLDYPLTMPLGPDNRRQLAGQTPHSSTPARHLILVLTPVKEVP
jgi:hypothetical protein